MVTLTLTKKAQRQMNAGLIEQLETALDSGRNWAD